MDRLEGKWDRMRLAGSSRMLRSGCSPVHGLSPSSKGAPTPAAVNLTIEAVARVTRGALHDRCRRLRSPAPSASATGAKHSRAVPPRQAVRRFPADARLGLGPPEIFHPLLVVHRHLASEHAGGLDSNREEKSQVLNLGPQGFPLFWNSISQAADSTFPPTPCAVPACRRAPCGERWCLLRLPPGPWGRW
jgi:hypothetical protein